MRYELEAGAVLRTWRPEDAASLASHANDREIWQNLRDAFPHPYTVEDAHAFIAQRSSSNLTIAVDSKAVGGIGVKVGADVERFGAELGYWLGRAFWGRGIVTSAVRAMTRHAFDVLQLHRIFAMPYATNRASARVLEKAGYSLEGVLREHAHKDGRFVDQLMYATVMGRSASGPRHALTILAVSDVEAVARFYDAALGWPRVVTSAVYVELAHDGGQRLGIYERSGFGRNTGVEAAAAPAAGSTSATELYFIVTDLDRAIARMERAGARMLSARATRDWGDEAAYFTDPVGNVVVLATPVSDR